VLQLLALEAFFQERCFDAFDFTEGERQRILATASKALSRAMTVWRNCLPNSSLFGPFVMAFYTACASNRPQRSSIEMPTRTGPWPGRPVIDISPPVPCAIWSTRGRLEKGPVWPNPPHSYITQ